MEIDRERVLSIMSKNQRKKYCYFGSDETIPRKTIRTWISKNNIEFDRLPNNLSISNLNQYRRSINIESEESEFGNMPVADEDPEHVPRDIDAPLLENNDESDSNSIAHSVLGERVANHKKKTLVECLMFMVLKYRHNNMTFEMIEDFSKLLNIENDSREKISKYKFKKLLKEFSMGVEIHHLCNKCKKYVGVPNIDLENEDENDNFLFCDSCQLQINSEKNIKLGNVFLYIPLIAQLKAKFENEDLSSYFCQRKKENENAIEDIFDGSEYKKIKDQNVITINFNIDGIPISRSSNRSALPILCTINESHPKSRRKNIMLISIWCGNSKPQMREYLKPFIEEARILSEQGFEYTYNRVIYRKKCKVFMGIFDSVARPTVVESKQFNGAYGCSLCLNSGIQIPKGRGSVRIYPVDQNRNPYGNGLRKHEECEVHAENRSYGFKGRSALFDIPDFNIISGVPVDWMHAVLLGVCRQFLKVWFQSNELDKDKGNFRHHLKNIDALIKTYKPTSDASRILESVSDPKDLKAHELYLWLLSYSLVTIKGIFPRKYVDHWSLLVDGISILLKTSIMKSEIFYAHQCLLEFVQDIQELYGREQLSFNVHLLTHLASSVLNGGPLWSHSAFLYEDFNQEIKASVHSSQGVAVQICDYFRLRYAIHNMKKACTDTLNERQCIFLHEVLGQCNSTPNIKLDLDYAQLVGEPITKKLGREYSLAFQRLDIDIDRNAPVQFFSSAFIYGEIIQTANYTRIERRANYFVSLVNDDIFEITTFVIITSSDETLQCFAIGKYFERIDSSFIAGRRLENIINLGSKSLDYAVVDATEIRGKVTLVENTITKNKVAIIPTSRYELLR